MQYIMALDQGTTSSRCMLFDLQGNIAARAQMEFSQYYPQPGWVEHDPEEIFHSQYEVACQAMQNIGARGVEIAAIGISNQRETAIIWDRKTGECIHPAIVWQCRRTADACEALKARGLEDLIRKRTGLVIDPYFSATKIRWILDHVPGAQARAERGELAFGTVDSYLIWRLSGGSAHLTDYTNAARTMLFNIHTLSWDDELLALFDIPRALLPEVRPSSGFFANSEPELFGRAIPICAAAGDQHAALFGQTCFAPGEVKNTYGTGAFMLMQTGARPVDSSNGLLTTIAWGEGSQVDYALEGSVFIAGAVVQWLRDELGLISSASESESWARKASDSAGVYVVPAFTGLGAPYWDSNARGTITGLTRGARREHIIRAALESIAYQTQDVLALMRREAGVEIPALRVDGGASANNFLMQFQADISDIPVLRPASVETTAQGAAFLAGLACGVYSGREEIAALYRAPRRFMPHMDTQARITLLAGWQRAVRASRSDGL